MFAGRWCIVAADQHEAIPHRVGPVRGTQPLIADLTEGG